MHFFYLDETGCTGADLESREQPIFVVGGISVGAQGWWATASSINSTLKSAFGGHLPDGFELHAHELINGQGVFERFERQERNELAFRLLDIISVRRHSVHFVGIDKSKLARALPGGGHQVVRCDIPYLLGFNYIVSYVERYTKERLGRTIRSMIIVDNKDCYHDELNRITHFRRFDVPKSRALNRIVEFSYPIDSLKHPMIQLSDLVIFLVRKFLELEGGYKPHWPDEAKSFYAKCYRIIIERVEWTKLIDINARFDVGAHALLSAAHATHRPNWRRRYNL